MIEIKKEFPKYAKPEEVSGIYELYRYLVVLKDVYNESSYFQIVNFGDDIYGLMTKDTNYIYGYRFKACCIEELLNKLLDEPGSQVFVDDED